MTYKYAEQGPAHVCPPRMYAPARLCPACDALAQPPHGPERGMHGDHVVACMCSLFADSEFFGAAMGISESFLSLGWIVGPLLGGYTADVAGFAAPFILTGGLALLATPVLYFLMPEGVPPTEVVPSRWPMRLFSRQTRAVPYQPSHGSCRNTSSCLTSCQGV